MTTQTQEKPRIIIPRTFCPRILTDMVSPKVGNILKTDRCEELILNAEESIRPYQPAVSFTTICVPNSRAAYVLMTGYVNAGQIGCIICPPEIPKFIRKGFNDIDSFNAYISVAEEKIEDIPGSCCSSYLEKLKNAGIKF